MTLHGCHTVKRNNRKSGIEKVTVQNIFCMCCIYFGKKKWLYLESNRYLVIEWIRIEHTLSKANMCLVLVIFSKKARAVRRLKKLI